MARRNRAAARPYDLRSAAEYFLEVAARTNEYGLFTLRYNCLHDTISLFVRCFDNIINYVHEIDASWISAWVSVLAEHGATGKLIESHISYLNLFFEWLVDTEWVESNPISARRNWVPRCLRRREVTTPGPAGEGECPIRLLGQGLPFWAMERLADGSLRWLRMNPLSEEGYVALGRLARVWPRRLPGKAIPGKGPGSGFRNTLDVLRRDPILAAIIDKAGAARRGYGLVNPHACRNVQKLPGSSRRARRAAGGTLIVFRPEGDP